MQGAGTQERTEGAWASRLRGQVAFITGAGNGIGKATALRLAAEGAAIGIATLLPDEAAEVVAACRQLGVPAAAAVGDLSSPAFVTSCHGLLTEELGAADVLVNNVAVGLEVGFLEADDGVYERTFALNFMGAVRFTRLVLPTMINKRKGSIVNVSSMQGEFGWPGFNAYSASKGALMSWSRQLANEFGSDGIRFNSVLPGAVMTPMQEARIDKDGEGFRERTDNLHILQRMAEPHEIAAAIAFLACDDASFITGTDLVVDGGIKVKAHWYP